MNKTKTKKIKPTNMESNMFECLPIGTYTASQLMEMRAHKCNKCTKRCRKRLSSV